MKSTFFALWSCKKFRFEGQNTWFVDKNHATFRRFFFSVVVVLWLWLTLVLEVLGVNLGCVVLKFRVHDIVSPTHHLGILDCGLYIWESHLQVIALRVEAIVGGRSPLHEWWFEGALCVKLNDPVFPHRFVRSVIVYMFLLGHINASCLVHIFFVVNIWVGRDGTTTLTRDTCMGSHSQANFVHVFFVQNLHFWLLHRHSLNRTVLKLLSVWLGWGCGCKWIII